MIEPIATDSCVNRAEGGGGWSDERVDYRPDGAPDPASAIRRRRRRRPSRARSPTGTRPCTSTPPEGAPNVLLVLIDDAGFGNPSTFGGPIDTPNYTRMAEEGLRYNRFHVTAVCSPTRAAMLTGRNQHRVGFGLVAEFSGPFPGYNATIPRDCATLPRILQENGYMTVVHREVASDARQPAGLERAVQPLAERARVRLLLGLPRRRGGPVRPAHHREPEGLGRAGGQGREALLLPGRHGREGDRLAPSSARGAARDRGSCTTRPAAATLRTKCRESGRTSTRASSTRAGTSSVSETLTRQKELGVVPPDTELPRERRVPDAGTR